ncbi:MAG TPA: glycosyltransferase family 39 protein, partial [Chloroflexota bacterium]|nr:glycosyltransferase family 39 protein [Chloroflexota bacterium]
MLKTVRVPLASLRSGPGAGLAVIISIFVLLATTYNATNPVFEAPDEVWHYLYVRHLADQHTLPRLDDPSTGSLSQQESFQAPIYYVTAALLTFWAPRRDFAEIAVHNFAGSMGDPGGVGNRNMNLHGPDQQFPYHGEILTVHLVRAVTTLWGVAAVIFTFLAARRVFNSEYLALAATAVVALNPEFLYLSAAVSNDVPVGAMGAMLLWLSIRSAHGQPSVRSAVFLGFAAGALILTKSIAAGMVAIPLIAIAL